MKNNRYTNWFFAAAVVVAGFSMAACEDEPDKYEVAGGKPTLKYVRVPDPAAADSLLTGAYMANTICLVGENLRSVYELYFNDQKAILNTSYITDHTLMVDVPKEIPSVVTDKIYMVTKAKDTIDYDFKVLVPAPTVNSISCEFAKPGSEVTLIGDYFIDDPNVPLTITMAGNVEVTNITNITKTAVSFILPDNAPDYWPEPSAGYPELSARPEFAELLEEYGVNGLQLKFEVNIPSSNPWQSCALQVMFTGNDVVTYATGTNAYFSDTNVPRGLWLPWKNTGSYDTGGKWTTVSMNLSEFNKTHEGNKCDRTFDKTMLTGLTFFVWAGGVEGKDCNPVIMIDNIRVVPIE